MELSKNPEAASEEEASHGYRVLPVQPHLPLWSSEEPLGLAVRPLIYVWEQQNPKAWEQKNGQDRRGRIAALAVVKPDLPAT